MEIDDLLLTILDPDYERSSLVSGVIINVVSINANIHSWSLFIYVFTIKINVIATCNNNKNAI